MSKVNDMGKARKGYQGMEQEGRRMSLLIKGMEMPKKCTECLMREPLSDYCELLLRYLDREELNGRDADCPLAELPEKHGRLIDADALIAKYGDWYTEEGTETGFIGTIGMLLKDAPTVVEAEGKDREAEMSDLVERSGITQNCGYCHTDNEGFVRLPLEKHAHAYIWRSADRYGIELRARGWAGRVEINFCPMCGRRLSNERFNRETSGD